MKEILSKNRDALVQLWANILNKQDSFQELIDSDELTADLNTYLKEFLKIIDLQEEDFESKAFDQFKAFWEEFALKKLDQGFSAKEISSMLYSFKNAMYEFLKSEIDKNEIVSQFVLLSFFIDKISIYAFEEYLNKREEIILRQKEELLELSTPVIQVWDQILVLPLIGTLDSERTQKIMENLLTKIVETQSTIAIIDITGVPMVDTLVAQHLLKTVSAARLMGAECLISGIRPQIAQTIVHLGVDLGDIITKSSLEEALKLSLSHTGYSINKK